MAEFDTSVKVPRYAASLDFDALWKEFPPADEYFNGPYQRPRDEIVRRIQNERFLEQMKRAWKVPFYQRHWGAHGMSQAISVRSMISQDSRRFPSTISGRASRSSRFGPTTWVSIPSRTSPFRSSFRPAAAPRGCRGR